MQKFKIARWPTYNPVGDVLRTKLIWSTYWISGLASPSVTTTIPPMSAAPFMFTDLYELVNSAFWSGSSHPASSAAFDAAVFFRRYRCTGIKIQWQSKVVSVGGVGAASVERDNAFNRPYQFGIMAGGPDNNVIGDLAINPFITTEQRWAIMKNVDPWIAEPKWHSVYLSASKLIGLGYNKTDLAFSGLTDNAVPGGFAATGRPGVGPFLRMGIVPASGIVPVATYDPNFQTQLKFTLYVTYFEKIPNTLVQ